MEDTECKTFRNAYGKSVRDSVPAKKHNCRVKRYLGEYMYEASEINIKLLYIPLVQLSIEKERITMPLFDDYDPDYYE